MPKYRGIDQTEIVDSIENALAFLKALDIGPACNDLIALAENPKDLARIRNAKNVEQLVYAMNESDVEYTLTMLGDALRYHARANTDNKGFDILKNVSKWSNSGLRDMGLHRSDVEISEHIAELPSVGNLYGPISGIEGPFQEYGVVFPDQTLGGGNPAEMERQNAKLFEGASAIFDKYYKLNEVELVAVGLIGKRDFSNPENMKKGVSFVATRTVAQAIADAFPDHTVINKNDEVITPQAKSHAANVEKSRAAESERTR